MQIIDEVIVENDQNSLFRCMSIAIYNSQNFHQFIRKEITKFIIENWENEKHAVAAAHKVYDKNAFSKYMSESQGTTVIDGTEYEAFIFTKLFHRPVKIFNVINGSYTLVCHYNIMNLQNRKYAIFARSYNTKNESYYCFLNSEPENLNNYEVKIAETSNKKLNASNDNKLSKKESISSRIIDNHFTNTEKNLCINESNYNFHNSEPEYLCDNQVMNKEKHNSEFSKKNCNDFEKSINAKHNSFHRTRIQSQQNF